MNYSTADNLIRHVTLRQLQIFEAVVRLKGYTRAAESLHLTQPTVSMQIRKLSEALGLTLIEQTGRRIQPTAAGREVYATTQDILEKMVSLGNLTSELTCIIKGELSISAVTSSKFFMPHFLGAFIQRHPQVQPRLMVTNRAKTLARIKSNKDDLYIMGQVPKGLAVQAHPFIDNELVVIAPSDHHLAGKKNITLKQLTKERFLVRESGSGTQQAVNRAFLEKDIKIKPYMELGSSEAIKQGVMANLGISVQSRHNLRLELAGNHLAILDVQGFPLKRHWYVVHLKNKQLTLATQTFLDFLLTKSNFALLSS
jgi:DNA-binding transcriptional LysR family regulator